MQNFVLYAVYLGLTFGLLAASGAALKYDMDARERMLDAEGTVTRCGYTGTSTMDADGNVTHDYECTVDFVDQNGVERTIYTDDHATVGSSYAFRYDPNSPNEFSTGGGRLLGIGLGVPGLALLGFFFWMLISHRRELRKKPPAAS